MPMRLLQVLVKSLRSTYDEMILMVGLSLLWWLAQITIFASAPASAALAYIGYRIAQGQRVSFDFAREALREHFWLSWRVGAAAIASAVLIAVNIVFYLQFENWLSLLVFVFIYLAMAWFSLFMYAFPMIGAMAKPRGRDVLRNAAIISFANPLFSLVLVLVTAILAAISVALVLPLLILPGFAAILGANALTDRVEVAQKGRAAD